MKTKKYIKLWIVEDHKLFQRTLVKLINDQHDMKCEKLYSSCEDAVRALSTADAPDAVLHDIGFVGMNGIASVEIIKKVFPQVQIIMFTVYDDAEHIFNSLCAGATGYLLKSSSEETIIGSIRDVLAGGSPMNSSIARKVIEYFSKLRKNSVEYNISSREKDILELIIKGFSNNMIAAKLHLSVHTIDTHLRKIYEKLHVHSRTEAATKVLKEKLI